MMDLDMPAKRCRTCNIAGVDDSHGSKHLCIPNTDDED